MAFDFGAVFGNILKSVASNPSVQQAGTQALKGVADQLTANAHNPEAVKAIAAGLQQNAPAIVGAIVKGTPAEKLVDPAILNQPPVAAPNPERRNAVRSGLVQLSVTPALAPFVAQHRRDLAREHVGRAARCLRHDQ